ncbi:3,4-dihydroxy-2-butanone-4-phosphate synthase [Spirochaeta africana]|uniref:3,4-dihydroxy-2-butanone 4-phosphate synthase n=1 Tax=Spirochaeta africana (strain ATCC 700263 / DSM 8902 / Z-7692) TaxID=889378 RepID=H9UIQ4_SPIAZ|nr:3,4-dihydroxy-2-butanone-4-phosphate synthase [Spirochaeta africana]AFG37397.1 3,4-dihydroxy-2-butanone 4-phosphate synthase [Spirochaeta africana DSM 8902]
MTKRTGFPAPVLANLDATERNLVERIQHACAYLAAGGIIIVSDDHDRENEGDFVCISELTTPDMVNYLITEGRGLVCQAITPERAAEIQLPLMVRSNTAQHQTNFTISVDYLHGTTTGISTADRAATIRALADPTAQPEDFGRPGHIFPLIAHPEGIAARRGHTEASVCLAELAGYQPNAVICEILNPDGSMARGPQLDRLAEKTGMPFITIEELTRYQTIVQED